MRYLGLAFLLIVAAALPARAQIVQWDHKEPGPNETTYFDSKHSEAFAYDVLQELTAERPPAGESREELAERTLALLTELPVYGQKETAELKPPIPQWLLDGYARFEPTSVQHSRYLDGVIAGRLEPWADIATLYTAWCAYDAEWFALSRHADYKAWLTALLLTYPPAWEQLDSESAASLHARLVVPLKTKDEPYREIDNWIDNFKKAEGAYIKPKARDALVEELLAKAGMDVDTRFIESPAYAGPAPSTMGLTARQFYLEAALVVEFHHEIYQLEPATRQLLWFRDYFLEMFRENME